MKPTIDYAHRTARRHRPWGTVLLVIGLVLTVPLLLFGCVLGWLRYDTTRSEVVITVDNQASAPVDATLLQTGAPAPVVTLNAVAAGHKAHRGQNTWQSIVPAVFRVRVGTQTYEGDAGSLFDDNGPHRFEVQAFDDHVVVTYAAWDLNMRPVGAASQPANR